MALATYSDLVNQVRRWTNRSDLEDEDIQSFIQFSGNAANQVLRVPAMEFSEILTVSEGGKVTIPFDFLEMRAMTAFWNDEEGVPLERIAWDQFVNYRNNEDGDRPRFFSRQGPYIWLTPEPAPGTKVTIHYYRSMPDISTTEQTNWLLDLSPMGYLYGALHYAHLFLLDEDRAEYWNKKYSAELERIQNLADSSEYKGSSLTVRLRDTSGVQ